MTNYKEHCTKYLSNRLRGSSDWRRAQGTKFPSDTRNEKASQWLLELESSIVIPDAVWNERRQDMRASRQNWAINKILIKPSTIRHADSPPIYPVAGLILRTGTPEPLVKLPRLKIGN
jgi:hypothetical protein